MLTERVEFSKEEIALLDGLSARLNYLPSGERPGVMNAAKFMMKAFAKSKIHDRDSGGIWASHSIRTMEILAGWHLPAIALEEGGLHDVVEDTAETNFPVSLNDLLATGFSPTVVDGVGRLGIVKKYHDQAQIKRGVIDDRTRDQELRAMFFESLLDHPSVVLVRIAERLDNLENIWPRYQKFPQSAQRTARESLEVYLPFLWELGMYETANLYAGFALGILYPDQMKDLGAFLPTFQDQHQALRKSLAELMGINLDDFDKNPPPVNGMSLSKLDVYPPSYRDLANLLIQGKGIKQILPEEVPYLADVVYENVGEVGAYVNRLVNSGRYHFGDSVGKYWQDLGKGGERVYYLTLIPKTRPGVIPSPIKITFLTQDMLIDRQASILQLHRVGEIDAGLRTAAYNKIEAVSRRINKARPTGPSTPEREVVYERAVKDELMTVSYSTNGEIKTVSVKKRSSVLDVLLEALSPEDLMHCRGVKISGKALPFNHTVSAFSQIEIDLDSDHIYLTPDWLDDFRQSEEVKREVVKSALRSVIDGKPIDLEENKTLKYPVEYRYSVIDQARQRALTRIYEKYSRMKRDPKAILRLDVVAGFDEELRHIYGEDRERFLIEAGIGDVSEQKLDMVVRNLIDIRQNRLIPMTLYVPQGQDQPGWASVFSGALRKNGLNIRIIDGGGSNDEGMAMFITYYFDPPAGISSEDLPSYLDELRRSILLACRQNFQLTSDPPLIFVIPLGLQPKSK